MPVRIDSSDVELLIAGQTVSYNEKYVIKMGVFDQPSNFNLTFGWGQSMGRMLENVVPYYPFQLKIGGQPAFKGHLDDIEVNETKGTTMTLVGRDNVADLMRYKTDSNVTFTSPTYSGLLEDVLKRIGVVNPTIVGNYQEFGNKRAGSVSKAFGISLDFSTDTFVFKESISEINNQVKAKTSMTWFSFLQDYFNRAGLFLWSGPNGEYVLSRPNANQEPTYRLVRGRGEVNNAVNVRLVSYKRSIADRHAIVSVNARGGGTKAGRQYFQGQVEDEEMKSFGLNNYRSVRDRLAKTPKEADGLARRIRAEERRKGFALVYEAPGHRGITPRGGQAVYTFDRTVRLDDYELDLHDDYYIADCEYARDITAATTTKLTLLRKQDLVF